jgi:hypothetical protein
MLKPAAWMSPAGIMMRPMNYAPFPIPVIFPTNRDLVSISQTNYSRCDIDIVSDEECLARAQFQDEPLMPAAIVVVTKNSLDHSAAFDLKVANALFEGAT